MVPGRKLLMVAPAFEKDAAYSRDLCHHSLLVRVQYLNPSEFSHHREYKAISELEKQDV
jgi:hypothetical protein